MSKIVRCTLFLLALFPVVLSAQPQIAYMFPDVGTPGMNTYVEIISPYDRFGTYGNSDGFWLPVSFKVEHIVPADSDRVIISPCVVSWDGRLAFCQFFVKSSATLGPVPVRLRNGAGIVSNVDTFWIVAPQTMGSKTGGGVIGSGGVWGTRSRRGAMIVDSMILSSGNYTVSTTDCDPVRNGNQGYLPFVLISKGRIIINSGASLGVNAAGKNGGPGGGGGGGYGQSRSSAPAIPGEADCAGTSTLGEGFSAGKNMVGVLFGINISSPGGSGIGSGLTGAAMNNLVTNNTFSTQRFFSSGLGHPFDNDARSGGAAAAATGTFFGIYYGGGGNATSGQGTIPAGSAPIGGQVIGNKQIAPLHGGSGGASGGSCDSVGGGGGGGMAIYSMTSASISSVTSNGGNGKNGTTAGASACSTTPPRGDASAGGAGGCIIVGGKKGLDISIVGLTGGTAGTVAGTPGSTSAAGGVGRFREDGRLTGTAPTLPTGSTTYTGPTLDTITYADSIQWTLRGTGTYRGGGDTILIYIRGHSVGTGWGSPFKAAVASDSTWSTRVAFPVDSMGYIYVLQKSTLADTSGQTQYTKVPHFVSSQLAAAIVRLNLIPKLGAPSARNLGTVKCGSVVYDSIMVYDSGSAPLILKSSTAFIGASAPWFTLVTPVLPDTLHPGDSVKLIYRYDPTLAPNNAPTTGTLRLQTNDAAKLQWDITISTYKSLHQYSIGPKALNVGTFYLRTTPGSTQSMFRNLSTYQDSITDITLIGSMPGNVSVLSPNTPIRLAAGDSAAVPFQIQSRDTGAFTVRYEVITSPCGKRDTITITGYIRSAIITTPYKNKIWEISGLACGDTATQSYSIRNVGNDTLTLGYPALTGTDAPKFTILSPPAGTFPRRLARNDSVVFNIKVVATAGIVLANLSFVNNDSTHDAGNSPKNPYLVQVQAVRDASKLDISDSLVDFGTVCVGDQVAKNITLTNGSVQTKITVQSVGKAGTNPDFTISPGSYPVELANQGANITATVFYQPSATGTFMDSIVAVSQPCNRRTVVYLKGVGIRAKAVAPASKSFGQVPVGLPVTQTIWLKNANPVPITIDQLTLAPANPQVTIISPVVPPIRVIPANDSIAVVVQYKPTSAQLLPSITLCAHTSAPCQDNACVALDGEGINSQIALTRTRLDMAIAPCVPGTFTEDTLTVYNLGLAPLDVTSITSNLPAFTVVAPAPTNFTLGAQGTGTSSRQIRVRYTPVGTTAVSAKLTLNTSDPGRPKIDVDITGRKDTAALRFMAPSLSFGQVYKCNLPITNTVRLRNSGTVPDTINGYTGPGTGFTVTSASQIIIQPGTDTVISVTFNPPAAGTYTGKLALTVLPCLKDSVTVDGELLDITRSSAPAVFGQVTVGQGRTVGARVTNGNPAALTASGAAIIPANADLAIVPGQFPFNVPANGNADLMLSFNPTATGNIPAGTKVEIYFDSPCKDTLTADISGQGVNAGVVLNKTDIAFGQNLNCRKPFDTLTIGNSGNLPLTVSSISLAPPAASGFFTFNPALAAFTGRVIAPGVYDTLIVGFDPTAGPDGLRNGTLTVATDDPSRPWLNINLSGERISESLGLTGPAFTPVIIGQKDTKTYVLTNTGTAPINLTGLNIPPPFRVTATRPALPLTMNPGDQISVDVEFAPVAPGDVSDSLAIAGNMGCGPIRFGLLGRVNVSVAATATWINTTGRPGDTVLLALRLEQDIRPAAVTGYTVDLKYNKKMLIPLQPVFTGTLSNGYTASNFQVTPGSVTFNATGTTPIGGPGVLAYVQAKVALGDSLVSAIYPGRTTALASQNATLNVSAGTFTLIGFCPTGGDRLVNGYGAFGLKTVRPNPTSGLTTIEFGVVEQGATRLALANDIGQEVQVLLDQDLKPQSYQLNIDLGYLPSGTYYLQLRTRTQTSVRQMVIVQ